MTDEDIRKLAEEYAEHKSPIQEYLRAYDKRDNLNEAYRKEALSVLKFLSDKFCIVEKEKVEALQNEIYGEIMCAHDDDDWQSAAHYILDVMPRSFNELFNDTEI